MHRYLCLLILLLASCAAPPAYATTYFVRPDGGTAAQCTGTTDAAYPGSGTAQACAFANPAVALPIGAAALLQPGDTLFIGAGAYMMGYGSAGYAPGCHSDGTTLCQIRTIPSGIDAAHPTTITGDCSAPPELWGSGGLNAIFDLSNVHDITFKCLDLTDHSQCKPDGRTSSLPACAYGSGPWAKMAIHAADVANLTLIDLDLHGFAEEAIQAGRLTGTTTVTRVKIRGNARAGWNGDLGGNTSTSGMNAGALTFTDLTVSWNGCIESYPPGQYLDCAGSNSGGYGDGFSTARTGGVWTFLRPSIYKNTSDGLDMLYANGTGSVTVDRGFFARNVGNDIKISGSGTVTNNVIIGQCDWFASTTMPARADVCRAGGGQLGHFVGPNETQTWAHNTIIGNGSGLFVGDSGLSDSTDEYVITDNIFIGVARNGQQPFFSWFADGTVPEKVTYLNNLVWNTRNTTCDGTGIICKDPLLTNETFDAFNPVPLPGSPAWTTSAGVQP